MYSTIKYYFLALLAVFFITHGIAVSSTTTREGLIWLVGMWIMQIALSLALHFMGSRVGIAPVSIPIMWLSSILLYYYYTYHVLPFGFLGSDFTLVAFCSLFVAPITIFSSIVCAVHYFRLTVVRAVHYFRLRRKVR